MAPIPHVWPATGDIFPVIADTHTKPIQKQMKSKYPEEYLTLDKVGSEKPLASKTFFYLDSTLYAKAPKFQPNHKVAFDIYYYQLM